MSEKIYTPEEQIKFTVKNARNVLYNHGISVRLLTIGKHAVNNLELYKAEKATAAYKKLQKVAKFVADYRAKKIQIGDEVALYEELDMSSK